VRTEEEKKRERERERERVCVHVCAKTCRRRNSVRASVTTRATACLACLTGTISPRARAHARTRGEAVSANASLCESIEGEE